MSVWRDRARRLIAKLTADLPEDASLTERRKALRGKGFEAHQGTVWGRRMWGQEVRKYLGRHGDPLAITTRKGEFRFPEHIHFPFREPEHDEQSPRAVAETTIKGVQEDAQKRACGQIGQQDEEAHAQG